MTKKAKSPARSTKKIQNDLSTMVDNLGSFGMSFGVGGTQLSQTDTFYFNLRNYFISNNRQLLSEMYIELGLVQVLVDQPVDDAFRAGFEIKSDQLSPEEIEQLQYYVERNQVTHIIMQAMKWTRLFGGGAILLITEQDAATPLNLKALNEDTALEYRAVDLWELYHDQQNIQGDPRPVQLTEGGFYNYYGRKVHPSRVYIIKGKEATSFAKPRLRGWGMSELEKVVRPLNQYLKNQDVIFELLNEAKVDVYKIEGFNDALLSNSGTNSVTNRVQMANIIKNYVNAIVMDKEDEYEQKQLSFAGLNDVLVQIRQGIAADLKMPMTKLFGMSAAGFNSGEDDIENYNSMIEGEIRSKCKFIVIDLLNIACQVIFGFMPDDLKIEFAPLRILSAEQEEKVKNDQFNRLMSAYQAGTITIEEYKAAINKDALLPIEIDEKIPATDPIQGDFVTSGEKVK